MLTEIRLSRLGLWCYRLKYAWATEWGLRFGRRLIISFSWNRPFEDEHATFI
jgi:hypothetical protein